MQRGPRIERSHFREIAHIENLLSFKARIIDRSNEQKSQPASTHVFTIAFAPAVVILELVPVPLPGKFFVIVSLLLLLLQEANCQSRLRIAMVALLGNERLFNGRRLTEDINLSPWSYQ